METCVENDLREKLSAFAPAVGGTSLYLLKAISSTVDSCQADERLAEATARSAREFAARVSECEVVPGHFIDPDDTGIRQIESGYRAVEEHLPSLLVKKGSIDADARLDSTAKELLHVAYDRMIDALAELIEASKDLRAAVIRHDLAAEVRDGEPHQTVNDLLVALRA